MTLAINRCTYRYEYFDASTPSGTNGRTELDRMPKPSGTPFSFHFFSNGQRFYSHFFFFSIFHRGGGEGSAKRGNLIFSHRLSLEFFRKIPGLSFFFLGSKLF